MSNIAHELEDRIMDCWSVTSDIKLVYEEYLDSPEPMSEDELSNILIGIEYLYNRKFQRLWQAFEEVCAHGGVFLDKEQVIAAKKGEDRNECDNGGLFDDLEFVGHKVEFPTKEDMQKEWGNLKESIEEIEEEEIDITKGSWIDKDWAQDAEDEIASSTGKTVEKESDIHPWHPLQSQLKKYKAKMSDGTRDTDKIDLGRYLNE